MRISSTCSTAINTFMLIVGYGTDGNGVNFYRLKGSFGNNVGSGGYFLVERSASGVGVAGV